MLHAGAPIHHQHAVDAAFVDRGLVLPSQTEIIGAVQEASDPRDVVVCAAGSLPGDLHKLWRVRDDLGYHVEYAFSCMGYEIAGGLGVKMARPQQEVIVMVGDGSYMMMNSEIATSVMLGRKLIVVVLDNRGFGCIQRLQLASGWAFILSVVMFSGIQIGKIMLAGIPGAPTPFDSLTFLIPAGGVAFIVGWLLLGLSALMTGAQLAPVEGAASDSGETSRLTATGTAAADYRLDTELVQLLQDFGPSPSRVVLALHATLVRASTRRVLAVRSFEIRVPAPSEDPSGGVRAANEAASTLARDVAAFSADAVRQAPVAP